MPAARAWMTCRQPGGPERAAPWRLRARRRRSRSGCTCSRSSGATGAARGQRTAINARLSCAAASKGCPLSPVATIPGQEHDSAYSERGRKSASTAPAHEPLEEHGARRSGPHAPPAMRGSRSPGCGRMHPVLARYQHMEERTRIINDKQAPCHLGAWSRSFLSGDVHVHVSRECTPHDRQRPGMAKPIAEMNLDEAHAAVSSRAPAASDSRDSPRVASGGG
jgi:hypothetical protein